MPFLGLLVFTAAVVFTVFVLLGRWGYLISLGVALLDHRLIWRRWSYPAWVARFQTYLEQYVKQPHAKVRLVLAALLALGGYLITLAAIYLLFHPVQPGWSDALASVIVGVLGLALIQRGVSIFRHRGRLRLRSPRNRG